MLDFDRALAACRDSDPELFFPVGHGGPALFEIEQAKRICRGCEIRDDCLDYALDRNEQFGIWGGRTEEERRKDLRHRNKEARLAAAGDLERGRLAKAAKLHRAGLKPAEIAEEMRVAVGTVEKYLQLGGVV